MASVRWSTESGISCCFASVFILADAVLLCSCSWNIFETKGYIICWWTEPRLEENESVWKPRPDGQRCILCT
ncbi:hypothetical protein VTN31DRAFT_7263 [Thermomyces dupontii]|uniref:uncharacterized protein n=1 Tax=Talaromyces thermophilus TaxID=28565 RepID=UPI00374381AF